jgi:hypothetical protein
MATLPAPINRPRATHPQPSSDRLVNHGPSGLDGGLSYTVDPGAWTIIVSGWTVVVVSQ